MLTHILKELAAQHWAMRISAFEALVSIVMRDDLEVKADLFHQNPPEKFQAYRYILGSPIEGSNYAQKIDSLGSVTVYGPIVPRTSFSTSGMTSAEKIQADLNMLAADPNIENVLMVFDSPGGSVTGISETADIIYNFPKPIYGLNVGDAASAAYFLMSQTDKIYAVDTSTAGSIGVVFSALDFSKKEEKSGIRRIQIVSTQSPRKRPDLSTSEGQEDIQRVVDGLGQVFVEAVARGREVSVEKVLNSFGGGSEFVAKDALERGMIDEITTTADLINSFRQLKSASVFTMPSQQQKELVDMATKKQVSPPVDASKHTDVDLEAIISEAAATAVAEERTRLKAIEGIRARFEEKDPRVIAAVAKALDKIKFEDATTVESAENAAWQAAFEAQESLVQEVRGPRQSLAVKLQGVPTEPLNQEISGNGDTFDPERVKNLQRGYEKGGM